MHFSTAAAALVVAAVSVSADLKINNWCNENVYIMQSTGASGDYGPGGAYKPWTITASNGKGNILSLPWNTSTSGGTSVKISKSANLPLTNILQLEYDLSTDLFFDLSNLDGTGDGRVGTPFANDNVKVSPTGAGANVSPCTQVKCVAGKTCSQAYQQPNDPDTLVCPLNTGDMWLDLCEPTPQFNSRKRSQADKHLRRHLSAIN